MVGSRPWPVERNDKRPGICPDGPSYDSRQALSNRGNIVEEYKLKGTITFRNALSDIQNSAVCDFRNSLQDRFDGVGGTVGFDHYSIVVRSSRLRERSFSSGVFDFCTTSS